MNECTYNIGLPFCFILLVYVKDFMPYSSGTVAFAVNSELAPPMGNFRE